MADTICRVPPGSERPTDCPLPRPRRSTFPRSNTKNLPSSPSMKRCDSPTQSTPARPGPAFGSPSWAGGKRESDSTSHRRLPPNIHGCVGPHHRLSTVMTGHLRSLCGRSVAAETQLSTSQTHDRVPGLTQETQAEQVPRTPFSSARGWPYPVSTRVGDIPRDRWCHVSGGFGIYLSDTVGGWVEWSHCREQSPRSGGSSRTSIPPSVFEGADLTEPAAGDGEISLVIA
jgi:hypothetical protein